MLRRTPKFVAVLVGALLICCVAYAVSYTPNKAYPTPTVGADTNNWGTIQNNAMAIIDKNLGGVLSKSVAGGTNVTLSATEAQNLAYVLTGAITGNIQVLWPATKGVYLVSNQTSGPFTLTLASTGAGTSYAIAQGGFAIILSDGTNIQNFPTNVFLGLDSLGVTNNAAINGTMTAAAVVSTGNTTADGNLTTLGNLFVTSSATLGINLSVGSASLAAAGSDQGSATAVFTATSFVTSGSGGVKLTNVQNGTIEVVANALGSTVQLYPPSGAQIDIKGATGGTNAATPLAGQTTITCYEASSTLWMCQ